MVWNLAGRERERLQSSSPCSEHHCIGLWQVSSNYNFSIIQQMFAGYSENYQKGQKLECPYKLTAFSNSWLLFICSRLREDYVEKILALHCHWSSAKSKKTSGCRGDAQLQTSTSPKNLHCTWSFKNWRRITCFVLHNACLNYIYF